MMDFKARALCVLVGLTILVTVSFLVRRRRLYNVYAITWFMIGFLFLVTGVFNRFTDLAAKVLGIYSPTTAILGLAMAGMLLMLLHLSVIVTAHQKEIRRLEKELAITRLQGPK
jgi:hypothetical protein